MKRSIGRWCQIRNPRVETLSKIDCSMPNAYLCSAHLWVKITPGDELLLVVYLLYESLDHTQPTKATNKPTHSANFASASDFAKFEVPNSSEMTVFHEIPWSLKPWKSKSWNPLLIQMRQTRGLGVNNEGKYDVVKIDTPWPTPNCWKPWSH